MDPYRDELETLRAENERLRGELRAAREREAPSVSALIMITSGLVGASLLAFVAVQSLLNAGSDARFFLGLFCVATIVVLDVVVLAHVWRGPGKLRVEDRPGDHAHLRVDVPGNADGDAIPISDREDPGSDDEGTTPGAG